MYPALRHTVLLLFLFNIRSLASSNFITTSSSWRWHADPSWLISCEDNGRKNLKGVHYKNKFCMLVTLCERVLFLLLLFVRKQIFLSLWSIQSTILKWVLSKHFSVFLCDNVIYLPFNPFTLWSQQNRAVFFFIRGGKGGGRDILQAVYNDSVKSNGEEKIKRNWSVWTAATNNQTDSSTSLWWLQKLLLSIACP